MRWCTALVTSHPSRRRKSRPLRRRLAGLWLALPRGRRLNARAPEADAGEAEAMARLRAGFAGANAELGREFGLDLTAWGGPDGRQPDRTSP